MVEERLIEAVKVHRELYDTNDTNYMKIKLKNRIWEQLAKDLGLKDGEETKTLWLKLRGSYRDARRRQMKLLKSGVAVGNIKPWRFQKQMSFLESCMTSGRREGNIESDEDSQSFISSREGNEGNTSYDRSEGCEESGMVEDTRITDEESSYVHVEKTFAAVPHTSGSAPEICSKLPKKRRNDDNIRDLYEQSMIFHEERARERGKLRKQLQLKNSDDPLYNFFISMYQLTKTMPRKYQHKIKGQVFQAVSQAEEDILNTSSRLSLTPSPSSYSHQTSSQTWSDSP